MRALGQVCLWRTFFLQEKEGVKSQDEAAGLTRVIAVIRSGSLIDIHRPCVRQTAKILICPESYQGDEVICSRLDLARLFKKWVATLWKK